MQFIEIMQQKYRSFFPSILGTMYAYTVTHTWILCALVHVPTDASPSPAAPLSVLRVALVAHALGRAWQVDAAGVGAAAAVRSQALVYVLEEKEERNGQDIY